MKFGAKKKVFLLVAVGLSVSALLYRSIFHSEPDSLAILGAPTLSGNQFHLIVSNKSDRTLSFRLSTVQFKCSGEWQELQFPWTYNLFNGQMLPPNHPNTLLPGAVRILSGAEPKYISAPFETTAWRVAVAWSYERPTALERWSHKLSTLFHLGPPTPSQHTNYTSEIKY